MPIPKGKLWEWLCECPRPAAISFASHHPIIPMITSVAPTIPWPHCPMISMLNGRRSLSSTKMIPKRICPVLCPQPHSAPMSAFCAREGPTESGVNAAR